MCQNKPDMAKNWSYTGRLDEGFLSPQSDMPLPSWSCSEGPKSHASSLFPPTGSLLQLLESFTKWWGCQYDLGVEYNVYRYIYIYRTMGPLPQAQRAGQPPSSPFHGCKAGSVRVPNAACRGPYQDEWAIFLEEGWGITVSQPAQRFVAYEKRPESVGRRAKG